MISKPSNHSPLGLGQLAEAEQYLSQAQWTVLGSPECDPTLKARLHHNLGQLAAAKNNFTEARRHFAEDVRQCAIVGMVDIRLYLHNCGCPFQIYQLSVSSGPQSLQASVGYFHLGKVFLRENKLEVAMSLLDQVLQ